MASGGAGSRGPYAKSESRRAAIIEAAREVFALHGYRAGTLQQIAERAGMGQSALLHHFPGKEALLVAVLRERDDRGDDPSVRGGDFVTAVLGQAQRNESSPGIVELYTVLAGEAATAGHPARTYFTDRFARLRSEYDAQLRVLAATGALRADVDPATAAAGLVALWDGIQAQWLIGVPDTNVTTVLRDYLALLFTDDARPAALRP